MFNLKRLIFTMFIVLIGGFAYSQSGYVYNESLPVYAIASRSIFVCSDNSVVVLSNVDNIEDEWARLTETIYFMSCRLPAISAFQVREIRWPLLSGQLIRIVHIIKLRPMIWL